MKESLLRLTASFQHPYVGTNDFEVRVQHRLRSLATPLGSSPKCPILADNDESKELRADKLKSWFHGWVVGQKESDLMDNRPPLAAARLRNHKKVFQIVAVLGKHSGRHRYIMINFAKWLPSPGHIDHIIPRWVFAAGGIC